MIDVLAPIAEDLKNFEPRLTEYLSSSQQFVREVSHHVFKVGGKRVRPALFFLCADLIGYRGEHKHPIACAYEYIHASSLLHDDVIDNASVRRSRPTVNALWGEKAAILSGDLVYAIACRLLVRTRSLDLIDSVARCIQMMSESEIFQIDLLWKHNTSQEEYEQVVLGKTAVLFESCASAPAFLAEYPRELATELANFGRYLGYAFQIADDCIDFEGSFSLVGKPVASDILEGKVTLPLILGQNEQTPQAEELRIFLQKLCAQKRASADEAKALVKLVRKTNGLELAKAQAQKYAIASKTALARAAKILGSERVPKSTFAALEALTEYVIERKN